MRSAPRELELELELVPLQVQDQARLQAQDLLEREYRPEVFLVLRRDLLALQLFLQTLLPEEHFLLAHLHQEMTAAIECRIAAHLDLLAHRHLSATILPMVTFVAPQEQAQL